MWLPMMIDIAGRPDARNSLRACISRILRGSPGFWFSVPGDTLFVTFP